MKFTRTLAAVVIAGGLLAPFASQAQTGNTSDTYRQLNLFGEVFERVRADYVQSTTDSKLIEDAINGMLQALDPHSSYMNAKAFRDTQIQTRGEFGGLGIEVTMENGLIKVMSPIDDTPASRAGIKPADYIVQIDGEPVMGLSLQEAVDKMRGPLNSSIKLTIKRAAQDPFDLTLQRARIIVQSVKSSIEGDIGYIRIVQFSDPTEAGVKNAIAKFKEQLGPKLKGIVLDLRNNPGGLLDQAIAVSDAFLDKGEIVSTRGKRSEDAQRYNAKPGDLLGGLPMVVMVNGGSASASEIVAGALQDHKRAILLGTKSFGKGSVQTIMPLGGNQGALRLTTALYYTPSGRSIQAQGIDPDIVVEQARIERVEGGVTRREADLRGALPNGNRVQPGAAAPAQAQPALPPGATPTPLPPDEAPPTGDVATDYQLSRAYDLLRGIAFFNQKTATN